MAIGLRVQRSECWTTTRKTIQSPWGTNSFYVILIHYMGLQEESNQKIQESNQKIQKIKYCLLFRKDDQVQHKVNILSKWNLSEIKKHILKNKKTENKKNTQNWLILQNCNGLGKTLESQTQWVLIPVPSLTAMCVAMSKLLNISKFLFPHS